MGRRREVRRGAAARRDRAVEICLRTSGRCFPRGIRGLPPRLVRSVLLVQRKAVEEPADSTLARIRTEMFAPVQHPRLERKRRRHRAHRLRVEGATTGGRDRTCLRGRNGGSGRPGGGKGVAMERELLLEIGTEELPASWL